MEGHRVGCRVGQGALLRHWGPLNVVLLLNPILLFPCVLLLQEQHRMDEGLHEVRGGRKKWSFPRGK